VIEGMYVIKYEEEKNKKFKNKSSANQVIM
jgi:hypothetical protein